MLSMRKNDFGVTLVYIDHHVYFNMLSNVPVNIFFNTLIRSPNLGAEAECSELFLGFQPQMFLKCFYFGDWEQLNFYLFHTCKPTQSRRCTGVTSCLCISIFGKAIRRCCTSNTTWKYIQRLSMFLACS